MNCTICKRKLDQPEFPDTLDCGGDCLRCMAECGDPDCEESMKEITVEEYLLEQCEKRGAFVPKTVWPGRRGCPDREVVWPWGDIDKVELKRPKGGRYEAGQEQAHKEYAKRGVPVYLLRNKEAVDEYVRQRVLRYRAPALWSVVPVKGFTVFENTGDGWDIAGAG